MLLPFSALTEAALVVGKTFCLKDLIPAPAIAKRFSRKPNLVLSTENSLAKQNESSYKVPAAEM